ncbi:PucR family transcriptional regulator [Humibacillus xanthopallidus]|uniref:PucR family transcriptional regulator n=1 Tax=Humibacillus xanthopallidus TaxID=412689 RepID=UPI0021AB6157|nr:helix-turn-helix domain-containing protein [Humibacillus xanthopallidus]
MRDIVEAIIEGIPRDVPVYAMPMEGRFGQGVRQGVTVALHRFLDLPGTRLEALSPDGKWIYESLGRGEVRSGRSLESLLAAYRYGARVTFRAISRLVDVSQMPPDVLLALGESLFAYIDEISAASAQGYAQEQSERAGEQQRLRAELLEMLLRGDSSDGGPARLAAAVGWTLPESVLVALVPFPHVEGLRAALGPDALVAERGTDVVVVLPATSTTRRRRQLDRALAGRRAVVGPSRPWQQAGESLQLATSAGAHGIGRLGHDADGAGGVRPGDAGSTVWVEDHLAELVVRAEPLATDDLARRRLAPLEGLRPPVRARLTETLLSWLRHQGQRAPIADELFVHQQTVGYRVAQLKQIFGDDLDDPEVRFELELVLRAGHR